MENYKIKRNPKPLTDEQINRHKDFDKLLGNHQKLHRYKDATKPLYKNFGFMCMMVLIGVVVLMLVLDQKEESSANVVQDSLAVVKADTGLRISEEQRQEAIPENATPDKNSGKTLVAPETNKEKTTIAYEVFQINPEVGAVLYTHSGIRMLVPALAFTDASGKLVSKEVTLRFREFSSPKEAALKESASFVPSCSFDIAGVVSFSNAPVSLSKPIVMELVSALKERSGKICHYSNGKKEWETPVKETITYRFTIQANDSQFPELALLMDLAWELPESAGNPSDFNYIFNRSWKSFAYKTTDKKELAVKNTNSSFKGVPDIAPILGDGKQDIELREAFYTVYNASSGKTIDPERQKRAFLTIENWKNSAEAKEYKKWLNSVAGEKQFYTTHRISKVLVNSMGFYGVGYASGAANSSPVPSRRVLILEKYPEKTQQYNKEMNQY